MVRLIPILIQSQFREIIKKGLELSKKSIEEPNYDINDNKR